MRVPYLLTFSGRSTAVSSGRPGEERMSATLRHGEHDLHADRWWK